MMGRHLTAALRRTVHLALAATVAVLLGSDAWAQDPAAPGPARPAEQPPAPAVPDAPEVNPILGNMRIRGFADVSFGRPPQEKLPDDGLPGSSTPFRLRIWNSSSRPGYPSSGASSRTPCSPPTSPTSPRPNSTA